MIKAEIRQKYRGLSRQELLDKAYELGWNYLKNSDSCSQSTVAALHELLNIDDVVVKVATSSFGGQALQGLGACGSLIGGTIALDYYFGRPLENLSDKEIIQANLDVLANACKVAQLLYDKYVKEYGTVICVQMQRQFFGRIYCFADPEEVEKFCKIAGNEEKCWGVVGKATCWVMEILLDKGAIQL